MGTATMRGGVCAFIRVSAAAAALAVFLGGCGERELPDVLANSAAAAVQPAPTAALGAKSELPKGTPFTPDMLGLQPGGNIGELRFNWYSGNADSLGQTFVRVFEGDVLVASEVGRSGAAVEDYLWHKAEVTGLKPNTAYTYSVSNDGVNWSPEYNYTSPPATGAFRFAAVSDVQYANGDDIGKWQNVARMIDEEGASLIVNAGDHVEFCAASSGGGEDFYRQFFSPAELRRIPTAPVMGNHDMCQNFEDHFNLPNVVPVAQKYSSRSGSNYYFLYNKVLFVGLNTSPAPTSVDEAGRYVDDYSKTIQEAKDAYKDKYDFLVVTHHKTTTSISAGGHVLDPDIGNYVSAGLQRLMTAKKVDLVLTGHDHLYVRSNFMIDDDPSEEGTGTLYLTLKPGGQTRNYNSGLIDVGFDVTNQNYPVNSMFPPIRVNLADYVDNYPFLRQHYRYGTNTTTTENIRDTEYFLPLSYRKHSLYDGVTPGYAIVEVAYGKMNINIYEYDGSPCDEIKLVRKSVGTTATGRLSKL